MRIIFSRVKEELEYFLSLINSEFDRSIPYYLIKINDDYYYEMFLKIERVKDVWNYAYLNHQVYYSGSEIKTEQLKELIEMLKKDKRSWKSKFRLTKQKKSKKLANRYLGLEICRYLGTEISDSNDGIDIKEYSEKGVNLGDDKKEEYEFINTWINFSPFLFMNKHQYKPFLDDIRECLEKYKWTIMTNQDAMEKFLDSLPDILVDIEKTGNKNFLKWLIAEAKRCIKEYKAEIDDEFQKFLDVHFDLLNNIKLI